MDRNQQDNVDKFFKDSLQSFKDKPDREVWENIEHQLEMQKKKSYLFKLRTPALAMTSLVLLFALGVWMYWLSPGPRVRPDRAGLKADQRANGMNGQEEGTVTAPKADGTIRPREVGGDTRPAAASAVLNGLAKRQMGTRPPGQAEAAVGEQTEKPTIEQVRKGAMAEMEKPAVLSRGQQVDAADFQAEQGKQSITGREGLTKRFPEPVRLAPIPAVASTAGTDTYLLLAHQINNFRKSSVVHLPGRKNRWSVTGYFAQELAGYNLADHDSTAPNGREVDKKETAVFSASVGMLVGYHLKKRWLLQSGLIYSWSNSISDPTVAYAVTGNNGSTKYQFNTPAGYGFLPSSVATGDSVQTDKSSSRLHYLSIPIIASYIFKTKEFTFLAGAGVIGNILTSAKVATTVEGSSGQQPESIVRLYGLRTINYGLIFKAEMQYAFQSNWSLNLMVTSKNALTSINTNGRYLTYPYYLGLGLGITHSF